MDALAPKPDSGPDGRPRIAVAMGVSGSGKSVLGEALAAALGCRFADGDRFHPRQNIERMAGGQPLRDEDRWAWLDAIAAEIAAARAAGEGLVVACSALKRTYRDRLRQADAGILFLFLDVGRDIAAERVGSRAGHFMPASLIDSQFRDLEPPQPDEIAVRLDAERPPQEMVATALAAMAASAG